MLPGLQWESVTTFQTFEHVINDINHALFPQSSTLVETQNLAFRVITMSWKNFFSG